MNFGSFSFFPYKTLIHFWGSQLTPGTPGTPGTPRTPVPQTPVPQTPHAGHYVELKEEYPGWEPQLSFN